VQRDRLPVAESRQRRLPSLVRIQSALYVLAGAHLDVEIELGLHFVLHLGTPQP